MNVADRYNADYFENGIEKGLSCYTDYRWLPDLTLPMAKAMVRHLGLRETDRIMDFGCAKGFVVKALRGLGYSAHGVDVSEYAISVADPAAAQYVSVIRPGDHLPLPDGLAWDMVIAKDVLEHIPPAQLRQVLAVLRIAARRLFVAVPLGDGSRYVIPEMEKDVTHRIRQPLGWWVDVLTIAGFQVVRSAYSMPGIKDNWVARYPLGNGFLIAE